MRHSWKLFVFQLAFGLVAPTISAAEPFQLLCTVAPRVGRYEDKGIKCRFDVPKKLSMAWASPKVDTTVPTPGRLGFELLVVLESLDEPFRATAVPFEQNPVAAIRSPFDLKLEQLFGPLEPGIYMVRVVAPFYNFLATDGGEPTDVSSPRARFEVTPNYPGLPSDAEQLLPVKLLPIRDPKMPSGPRLYDLINESETAIEIDISPDQDPSDGRGLHSYGYRKETFWEHGGWGLTGFNFVCPPELVKQVTILPGSRARLALSEYQLPGCNLSPAPARPGVPSRITRMVIPYRTIGSHPRSELATSQPEVTPLPAYELPEATRWTTSGADWRRIADGERGVAVALRLSNRPAVDQLLKAGVSLDAFNELGWLPLHSAVYFHDEALVEQLLKHGAKPDAVTKDGLTALHIAVMRAKRDMSTGSAIISLLLDIGAAVNQQNLDGGTVLHRIASWRCDAQDHCSEIIGLLVQRGADLAAQDNTGKTPAQRAALLMSLEAERVLRNKLE